MQDKRILHRRQLIYYLNVVSGNPESLFGSVVDLTTQGMMLMCSNPVEPDRAFSLKVLLPGDEKKPAFLLVKARSRWCRKSVNSDFYDAGFEFFDIAPGMQVAIEKVIEDIGFDTEH